MHIGINSLILRPGEYSGVHVAVRGLLGALAEHADGGTRLTLYVQRTPPEDLPGPDERIAHVRPFWPVGRRTGRVTWEQLRLPSRVFADGVDLLHCPAYVMPRTCVKPTVVSVHDIFGLTMPQLCTRGGRNHLSRMLPPTLERAQRVIVPTDHVRQEILHWNSARSDPFPGLDEKLRVIPWGVDERFAPVEDQAARERLELKYGLPPHFVLFVGRVEPKKNVQRVVQAYFSAVMSRGLPHRLVLAGPQGWGAPAEVKRIVKELGLAEKVHFLGFLPDEEMPTLYSMASALFFPSFAEGFGLPVLEAQACGTPVVCGDIAPLREVAGDAARFAPPADLPALREALEAVLGDDKTARQLAEAGQANAAKYTWERHAENTLALYREVLAEDAAR